MHQFQVAVIGAGFGGIGMAVALREAGIRDIVILERAPGIGGTWRHNTYPGSGCDVPSHLYSFSFAPHPGWSRRYASQPEILAYLEQVVDSYGLAPLLRCNTEVTDLDWEPELRCWRLRTGGGELRAAVVVSACGQLNRPLVPDLPGRENFRGPTWHSAQWNHDVDLTGRRVAVVGTGASAIQFVPRIAPQLARLDLYQRTPGYVIRKPDRAYPSWERRLYERSPSLLRLSRAVQYASLEARAVGFVRAPTAMVVPETWWRARMRRWVADPELRSRLTPRFRMGCKRILLANDYYETLTRPHVEVISSPVASLTATGLVDGQGVERPADAVIFATGFRATEFLTPMRVRGLDGAELSERWRHGAEAYLGMNVTGFPNFFLLYGPNTNLGHSSIVYMLESQISYVIRLLSAMRQFRLATVEVRPGAEREWDTRLEELSATTVWTSGCSSWYVTEGRNTNNWPGFTFTYRRAVRRVDLSRYRTEPAAAAGAVAGSGAVAGPGAA